MPNFNYKARDPAGKIKSGQIEASSRDSARRLLLRRRLSPTSLNQIGGSSTSSAKDPALAHRMVYLDESGGLHIEIVPKMPKTKDLIIFTKQFSTMLASGVPMLQSLSVLGAQQLVRSFRLVLEVVRVSVENGSSLSDAIARHPNIFDRLYVSMVRAGELSGNLDMILAKLVIHLEKSEKIRRKVIAAMIYPSIIMLVAVSVVSGLLIFVVPSITQQFIEGGKELPGLTQAVLTLSDILAKNYIQLGAVMAVMALIFQAWVKTDGGRRKFDKYLLKAPGFGVLLRKVAVGRFCSTLATMMSSGVNLLEALTITAATSGNYTIEDFVLGVRASVEKGSRLSEPLAKGGIFPAMVVSMVAVGEATGALDDMLNKVSEFYEDEVDAAVSALLSMIEPLLIVLVGISVGTIVIAMFLPIFDMGGIASE